jgi:dolichol kinase
VGLRTVIVPARRTLLLNEARRKTFHFLGLLLVGLYYYSTKQIVILVASLALLASLTVEYVRLRTYPLRLFDFLVNKMLRGHERTSMAAYVYWFAGSLPVILLLSKPLAMITIAVTLLGDTLAAIVGVALGRHKLPTNPSKSWEGTIAGTVTSFLVAMLLSSILLSSPSLPLSIIAAAAFATVDVIKLPIDDNFLMPIVIGFLLQIALLTETGRLF